MSLISNRGRFTQDNENNNIIEEKSSLSLIGVNPKNMLDADTTSDKEKDKKEDVKDKLSKIDVGAFNDNQVVSSHKEYNDKINRLNAKITKSENKIKGSLNKDKWKPGITTFIAMFLVEVLAIVAIFMFGSLVRYSNLTQEIAFDIKKVDNSENIAESSLAIMKGYKTVAIFGVDSRTGSVDRGNNADVNIVANLNLETGEVQLVSIYRDLYLSVTSDNLYTKLNTAYRKGGPEQAVKTINKNFDLNIDSYFAFNWKAVADGIQLLGGIDIEVTKSEFKYLNAFIHETCIATGIDAKNPAAHYVKSYGFQHLDGIQAVAYGRLRLMDSDFQRVERQKKIVGICLEKAKKIDINTLKLIVETVLPQIAYAFDMNEIFSLMKIVKIVHITSSTSCPEVSGVKNIQMGSNGDCVVPLNLQKSVTQLHKILYNVDNYNPSSSVKNYSARITELRHKYEEENKLKGTDGETQEGEENAETENASGDKTKKTTGNESSSTDKTSNKTKETAPNDLPIVDADGNANLLEEPEQDGNNAVRVDEPPSNSQTNNNQTNNNQNTNTNNNQNTNTNNNTNSNANSNTNNNTNTSNNSAPVSGAPGGGAPSNNDVVVYDAPGVPSTTANNNVTPMSPSSNSPGMSSNNASGQGVVVNGPPGSVSPNNTNSGTDVVPIIGAPN